MPALQFAFYIFLIGAQFPSLSISSLDMTFFRIQEASLHVQLVFIVSFSSPVTLGVSLNVVFMSCHIDAV